MVKISGPFGLWGFPILNTIIEITRIREEAKREGKGLQIEEDTIETNEETDGNDVYEATTRVIDDAGREMNEEIIQDVEIEEDDDERVFFIEQKDITKRTQFTPRPSDTHQDRLPIRGEGELNNFLVVSDSDNYDVTVYVDDRYVVDDSFNYLKGLESELDHVSAYSSNGKHVVNVSKYPFVDELDMDIRAREEMKFELIRVEGTHND